MAVKYHCVSLLQSFAPDWLCPLAQHCVWPCLCFILCLVTEPGSLHCQHPPRGHADRLLLRYLEEFENSSCSPPFPVSFCFRPFSLLAKSFHFSSVFFRDASSTGSRVLVIPLFRQCLVFLFKRLRLYLVLSSFPHFPSWSRGQVAGKVGASMWIVMDSLRSQGLV